MSSSAVALSQPPAVASRHGGVQNPVERFLALLGKTINRFRNYAPTSPLCARTAAQCHQALAALSEEQLVLRVTPLALLLPDQTRVGHLPPTHTELTRRLHRAGIGSLVISRNASPRDISSLCRELAARDGEGADAPLGDVLESLGIDRIQVTTLLQPAFLEVGVPAVAGLAAVREQQQWREVDLKRRSAVGHLYAPDKGWVRLDPTCGLETVSLGDLAVLVGDPLKLARMLAQLSEEEAGEAGDEALGRHFEQVTHLLRGLHPSLVEPMFVRLAQALVVMDADRRRQLIAGTLLPGLLDGRFDGSLLRQLPDLEIAEAIQTLGDVQVAAGELVAFALDRLGVPRERRDRIASLVALGADGPEADDGALTPGRIKGYTDGRIRIDHGQGKRFGDFSEFDVALTESAAAALGDIRQRISGSDSQIEQMRCVLNLLRLEPNPDAAERLLAYAHAGLEQMHQSRAWDRFACWLGAFRRLADALEARRPEVASLIQSMVSQYACPSLVRALIDSASRGAGREQASLVLESLGESAGGPLVAVLRDEQSRARRRVLLELMIQRAPAIAGGLVPHLGVAEWFVVRNLLDVLAHAGPGHEAAIGRCTAHRHPRVVTHAFRALAQVATPEALETVTSALSGRHRFVAPAFDALWRFPPETARRAARAYLGNRDLVLKRPRTAWRMLDRLARSGDPDLRPVLETLVPLRRRFWNLGAVLLGCRAAVLARRS